MDIEAELRLSFYREIAMLNEAHGVALVQHVETGKIFVKKTLAIYDIRVFRYLKSHPAPGIPRIVELIPAGDRLCVIEEYISGTSLREYLDAHGPLSVSQAEAYLRQLCDILRPLHRLSPAIVHRDIKPSNIILTSTGNLFLVDFNSAKETSETKERDTVLIGTCGYAAPEQYGFSSSRPTADLYALGVLLNEMLTGKAPQETMYEGPLTSVIQTCLQMDPAMRYQSVDELLHGIEAGDGAGFRAWLPPGLRSKKPYLCLLGLLWYGFITLMCSTIELETTTQPARLIHRLVFFALFLGETLWMGNYREVWRSFPLSRNENPIVKSIGVLFWGLLYLAAMAMAVGLLVGS